MEIYPSENRLLEKQVYRAKSKEEIISDAFGRWRGAGYLGY